MGLIEPTPMPPERDEQATSYNWYVGIDWGSQQHQVSVLDRDRRRVGERVVDHDGASLARLADWLWTVSAGQPQRVAVEGRLTPQDIILSVVVFSLTLSKKASTCGRSFAMARIAAAKSSRATPALASAFAVSIARARARSSSWRYLWPSWSATSAGVRGVLVPFSFEPTILCRSTGALPLT